MQMWMLNTPLRLAACGVLLLMSSCFVIDSSERYRNKVRRNGGFVPLGGDISLVVRNSGDTAIRISPDSWNGFGNARPAEGFVGPSGYKTMQWHWLERTPALTNVNWTIEPDTEKAGEGAGNPSDLLEKDSNPVKQQFLQSLDLRRLSEHKVENLVVFEFQKNGQWAVLYDEEAAEDWKSIEASREMVKERNE